MLYNIHYNAEVEIQKYDKGCNNFDIYNSTCNKLILESHVILYLF